MKYIHEGRMGAPKSYKTGAVVSSYPKPMLVLSYDKGGLDIIQTPIVYITPNEIEKYSKMKPEELPPILAIDFSLVNTPILTVEYKPAVDAKTFSDTVNVINKVIASCPWKTLVLDPVTGLSDSILGHLAATNPGSLADPRKWAGNIGMKVKQVISVVNNAPCHTVVIMHSTIDKNETSGEIRELPMIYSALRDQIGALFSQFFYATIENKKPVIFTSPKGFVKGIGARWPVNLPETCGANYSEIYERK